MAYKLTGQLRSTGKLRTRPIYSSSVAHQHTALLTLPDRSMPPIAMEADTVYQGCLPSWKLHSRSLAVGRTGACDLIRLRTCGLRNLEIAQNIYQSDNKPYCGQMTCTPQFSETEAVFAPTQKLKPGRIYREY